MKQTPRFRGPSLILLAVVHIMLFAAGLVLAAVFRHGAAYITPFGSAERMRQFFTENPSAVRVSNFFLFGSAVPFGIFAVTAVSRLRYYGVRATGTHIALFGGLSAAFALFLSGISGWTLSVPEASSSAALVKLIYFLSFLFGGVFYAVGFGLLSAGISITSYFSRLLPRWLVAMGMLIAITGEFASFSLISFPANYLIPFTRYVGFVWMILVATTLRRDRRLKSAISGLNSQ